MSKVMKAEKSKKEDWATKEFTSSEKNKILEKLITARVGLLLKHPFFGNLATRMKLVDASEWCNTLATDGRTFYYNNGFVNKLTPKEVAGAILIRASCPAPMTPTVGKALLTGLS
jgi:hypothetical protein